MFISNERYLIVNVFLLIINNTVLFHFGSFLVKILVLNFVNRNSCLNRMHYCFTLSTRRKVTSKCVTSVHLWVEEEGPNQWKCIAYPKKRVHKLLYILLTTIHINLKLNYVLVDNVFLNRNRISSSSSNTIHKKVSYKFVYKNILNVDINYWEIDDMKLTWCVVLVTKTK